MNLILLFKDDFIDENKVRLEGRRLRHILEVHRPAKGDELRVGLAGGLTGPGRITSITGDSLEMEVSLTRRRLLHFPLP